MVKSCQYDLRVVVTLLICLFVLGINVAMAADISSGGAENTPASPSPLSTAAPPETLGSGWGDAILHGGPVGPLLGDHSETLGDFHISGFMQNQTGIWVNPPALREFTGFANGGAHSSIHHSNSLSTERNWISVDTNYTIGPNSFFVRWYGVYEPAYPNENNLRAAGPKTEGNWART